MILQVENMLKNYKLAKSLHDASFGTFINKVKFKSDILGKWFVAVDPWGTTQFCCGCLTWVLKDLSERKHKCPICNADLPRDNNSSKKKEARLVKAGLYPWRLKKKKIRPQMTGIHRHLNGKPL